MKEWKTAIINEIVEFTKTDKIISLRDVANRAGYNHISTGDTRDIMHAVLKKVPEYHAVQMMDPRKTNESLFTTLNFIDNEVEFDDGEDFGYTYEIRKATCQLKKNEKERIKEGITWEATPDIDDTTLETFNTLEEAQKVFQDKYSVSKISGFETLFIEEYWIAKISDADDDPWAEDPIAWSVMPEIEV